MRIFGWKRPRNRGIAVLLTSLMVIGVMSIVGLAVDVGMMFAIKTKLSAAADAAALGGDQGDSGPGRAGAPPPPRLPPTLTPICRRVICSRPVSPRHLPLPVQGRMCKR